MTRDILFVAVGGMVGCVTRYLAVICVVRLLPFAFPFGTFAVNVLGSFLMGAAVGLAERYTSLHHEWRIFLTAGFCGGFTTFSAFALENIELLLDRNYTTFFLYTALTLLICLAAACAGLFICRG
jgi:fluoride exporter